MPHEIITFPQLRAESKEEVLREFAELIHAERPALAGEEIYSVLSNRESLGSTGIGAGAAIPHGKIKGLDQIIICFAKSAEGVPFGAPDNQPVHIFLVLLAPETAGKPYLHTLAWASRLLKNDSLRNELMIAEDRAEIIELFAKAG